MKKHFLYFISLEMANRGFETLASYLIRQHIIIQSILQPGLVLTSLMLCVLILHIIGGICTLKSTMDDRLVLKLFLAILFTLRVYTFKFGFDVWPVARTLALRLISQLTTYYTMAALTTATKFQNIFYQIYILT